MAYHLESLIALFTLGIITSLIVTWLCRGIGVRIGLVDQPDGRRKIHKHAIPLVGGVAVFTSTVLVVGMVIGVFNPFAELSASVYRELLGLLLGSAVICAIGVVDDCRHLRGRYKLLGQIVAVSIVILSGTQVEKIAFFGCYFELGWLAIPITMLWLLGVINSLNLLDGMDGLLGIVGTIVCLAFASMAAFTGQSFNAGLAMALAGALIGFLRYNCPPASVFLGDAGSMFIGLAIGVLAIRCSHKGPATAALTTPVALLILPILDTTAAVIRRKLTGRSIFTTDRGHLHHCLLRGGLSQRRILLLVSGLCLLTVIGALGSIAYQNESLALFSALAVIFILVSTGSFGCAEVDLIVKSLSDCAGSIISSSRSDSGIEVRLQGSAKWGELWKELIGSAGRLQLRSLSLVVNSPVHHECYHARWSRPSNKLGDEPNSWSAVILLSAWGQTIGQVAITGQPGKEPIWQKVAELSQMMEGIESLLTEPEPSRLINQIVGTATT